MRFNEFRIVETPEEKSTGLEAGPPYPPEAVPEVKKLQARLQELGYSVGSTGVDGKYGPRTTAAVRAFKKDNRIPGDGLSMSADDLQKLASAKRVDNPTPTGARAPGGELGTLSQDAVTQGKVGEVLNLIASVESAGRYDAVYPGGKKPEILNMTLEQLFQDMAQRGRLSGSSASGRYQYIRKTLESLASSMGLDPRTTKFDQETQDKIAIYHLRRDHGLDRWLAGRMSNEDFLNKLAGTWAGIPNTSGASTYAGVLDNKAGVGVQSALANLSQIQSSGTAA
jgi:peptidoglycan hydrolase-like protein with peptidoglycan-binding domain